MENSIEEDIKNAEHFIKSIKTDKEYKEENGWHGYYNKEIVELARMLEHILSDYKRVLKENEELKELNCLVKRYFKLKDTNTYLQKENIDLKAKLEYKQYGDLDNTEFERYINDIVGTKTGKLREENNKLKYKYAEYVKLSCDAIAQELGYFIGKIEELIEGEENNK